MNVRAKTIPVLVAIMMVSMAACSGCSSFSKTAYSSLGSAAIVVNNAMLALDDLYQRGYLSEEAKDKIVELHKRYRLAHRAAVTALEAYVAAKGKEKKDLKTQIEMQLTLISELVSEINRELIEHQAKAKASGNPNIGGN